MLKELRCVLTESLRETWENQEIDFYLLSYPSLIGANLRRQCRQVELAPGRAKPQDTDLGALIRV